MSTLGFAAATVMASLSTIVATRRPWFVGASIVLLALGSVQVVRARRACSRPRTGSLVVLGLSAAIVVLVILFPQVVAGLMADWLP